MSNSRTIAWHDGPLPVCKTPAYWPIAVVPSSFLRPCPVTTPHPTMTTKTKAKKPSEKRPRAKNRLSELRNKGVVLSQEQVGKLLDPPLDATSVSRHETGERALSTDYAKQYAAIFRVPTHEIFLTLPSEAEVSSGDQK